MSGNDALDYAAAFFMACDGIAILACVYWLWRHGK